MQKETSGANDDRQCDQHADPVRTNENQLARDAAAVQDPPLMENLR
jgi:hypothetical protein